VVIVIIQRYIYKAEDVQRYTHTRDKVQSQVEDSVDSRSDYDILGQLFGLEDRVPAIGVGSKIGEGSVWVGGIRMN
jgi:hypothetical protein